MNLIFAQTSAPKLNQRHQRHQRAFSLAEMLIVVAVIGVITALAVPLLSGADKMEHAKVRRNAQNFAKVANQAIAAGDMTIPEAKDAAAVVELLSVGIEGSGVFEGTVFRVPGLGAAEREAVLAHLSLEGGSLNYHPQR